jgi:hypothetical protein
MLFVPKTDYAKNSRATAWTLLQGSPRYETQQAPNTSPSSQATHILQTTVEYRLLNTKHYYPTIDVAILGDMAAAVELPPPAPSIPTKHIANETHSCPACGTSIDMAEAIEAQNRIRELEAQMERLKEKAAAAGTIYHGTRATITRKLTYTQWTDAPTTKTKYAASGRRRMALICFAPTPQSRSIQPAARRPPTTKLVPQQRTRKSSPASPS